MDIIVDANILFAALIKDNVTAELLVRNDFHLYAPEFIFEEFEEYKELILKKTERTPDEFERFLNILQRRITLVPKEELIDFLDQAKRISPDQKDVPYIAVALKLRCPIWSNDKDLKEKQNKVKIYHTHELLRTA